MLYEVITILRLKRLLLIGGTTQLLLTGAAIFAAGRAFGSYNFV